MQARSIGVAEHISVTWTESCPSKPESWKGAPRDSVFDNADRMMLLQAECTRHKSDAAPPSGPTVADMRPRMQSLIEPGGMKAATWRRDGSPACASLASAEPVAQRASTMPSFRRHSRSSSVDAPMCGASHAPKEVQAKDGDSPPEVADLASVTMARLPLPAWGGDAAGGGRVGIAPLCDAHSVCLRCPVGRRLKSARARAAQPLHGPGADTRGLLWRPARDHVGQEACRLFLAFGLHPKLRSTISTRIGETGVGGSEEFESAIHDHGWRLGSLT